MNFRRLLKSGVFSIVTSGLLVTETPIWAGPPFITDDPEPVEYQHSEMYIASSQTNSKSGSTVSPMVEYNYGVLPNLQLSITVPYVFSNPAGQGNQQGLGDLTLGAKYRFIQETDSLPMMAVYPTVITANGNANKGLGNGATQIFIPVWIQKSWGDWQSYGGGGCWINKAPTAHNSWYFGWELQKNISERLTIGGEIFHETTQFPTDAATMGFNLGGVYSLDLHDRVLFSAGREFTDYTAQHKYSSYIAYGLTW